MVNCRECDAEVSSQAKICPRCGIPKPWLPKTSGFAVCLGLFLIIVMCSYMGGKTKPAIYLTQTDFTTDTELGIESQMMVFVTLTIVWVIVMAFVTATFPTKTSIHEIQLLLIGLGFWGWLATIYIADRLRGERQEITDLLEEIREIQEFESQRKTMILSSRKTKPRS